MDRIDYGIGRWPANLIHDGSDAVKELFPVTTSGELKPWVNKSVASKTVASFSRGLDGKPRNYTAPKSTGSASRFFYAAPPDDGDDLLIDSAPPIHYCPKASKKDRDEGCEELAERFSPTMGNGIGVKEHDPETATPKRNFHPTVKPTSLMRYLCRLVTPLGGIVLDPFCGSGSTGKAAVLESFRFIGIDLSEEYLDIARRRITHAMAKIGAVAPPSAELRSAEPVETVQLEIGVVPPLPKQGRLF